VGLAPKFQIIAGTMKRKKDCIQFLRLKKKAHNPVTKEDVLMVINNNAHPTYQLVLYNNNFWFVSLQLGYGITKELVVP
jgi:hypothetical protein